MNAINAKLKAMKETRIMERLQAGGTYCCQYQHATRNHFTNNKSSFGLRTLKFCQSLVDAGTAEIASHSCGEFCIRLAAQK